MYVYGTGYDGEEIYAREGQVIGGAAIGIIVIGQNCYPLVPGNVANATTFDFPVHYKFLKGGVVDKIVSSTPDPDILEEIIASGKELQQQGCRAVVGACGYFANYLPEVASALDVPCFLSSLMQVPMISRALRPHQKIGILCANGEILASAPALENCGVDRSRIVIAGCEALSEMQNILRNTGHLNNRRFEQQTVSVAKQLVEDNSDIGALLLECSDMPPYALAIQKAVRLPVFDFTTMINWVYDAVVRRLFVGFM